MKGIFLEGLIFGGPFVRSGNFCLKIYWASLIVGRKLTVFALFCFVFEGNFQYKPPPPGGAYIRRGDLTEGVLSYALHGRGFQNFTVRLDILQL